ncbi:sigma 54-interacting transcriptional regulator [Thalassotalea mangrovi]|uniref:HTH-type transcriptional regulatory protein TyrR n=1 Tax=Thalassotalea mangrovi TaxID=2572245 RepID=A0A4U1B9W0_9GAMM|nr:sigma 54-interacting transcriptional regulator [Thalassotalea mangrovi]TKB47511.1 PAS domain-containing protein [Thalassotalea mangrovi]
MRLAVESEDRVGMTQEILAKVADLGVNLVAMEVTKFHTYLNLDNDHLDLMRELLAIPGVKQVNAIELLPGERTAKQLQAMLAKIPEPILDIDRDGRILMANQSALDAWRQYKGQAGTKDLIGIMITSCIEQKLRVFLTEQSVTQEITFAANQYFCDITPVKVDGKVQGALLVLRSLADVGRHLAATQLTDRGGFDNIVGHSLKLTQVIEQARKFSNLELPVLIQGETGTGKELLARAMHDNSRRARKPFLAINCASLAEHLLESELFGYAAGAFTGATSGGKPGLLELADGGTVFLDEIAEMSVYLQAKLLRFLQDYRFRRVGGVKEKQVDVRIISATHEPLTSLVEDKQFREDLFYRLNVLNLTLPPLRERSGDIPLLLEQFIKNAATQINQPLPTISPEVLKKLQSYDWPGNVRQLQNTLFRAVALAEGGEIRDISLQQGAQDSQQHGNTRYNESLDNSPALPVTSEQDANAVDYRDLHHAHQTFEKQLLQRLLPLYPSTRKLAERLGVSHNTIAIKLRQHGLQKNR